MTVSIAVVCFPGSNCDYDVQQVLASLGANARRVWHDDPLERVDAVVLPGGFAHGDYLRPGAIARFSRVMTDVTRFAASGGPVLGICNGFQVLTEAGLLPGALRANEKMRFICTTEVCVVASTSSVLTCGVPLGARLALPISHYEGNYFCSATELEALEAAGQVVLRYESNPNGSLHAIAGVANTKGNVVGLMPHPERACDALLGSSDGRVLLESFLESASRRLADAVEKVG